MPLEAEGWSLEEKFDGIKGLRKRKKNLKIKSPCFCPKMKRGLICKHLKTFEGLSGDVIVGDREERNSSDSEVLINMSNLRLRRSSGTACPKPFTDLSPEKELEELIEVGKAMGVKLENEKEKLEELLGFGDQAFPC